MVARLAVETEEERRARLENGAATKQLSAWPWRRTKKDKERKARPEKMVATKRLRLAMEMDEEQHDWRRW